MTRISNNDRDQRECVIFLSSPGDLAEERRIIVSEVRRLNALVNRSSWPKLRLIRWPEDIAAGAGHHLQGVINYQTAHYDIFVGMVGSRIGTPTPRANSGTEEEFDRAIAMLRRGSSLEILVFFSNRPKPLREIDPHQLLLVHYFREKVERLGVLCHTYSSLPQFKLFARKSLEGALCKVCGARSSLEPTVAPPVDPAVETITLPDIFLQTSAVNPQGAAYCVIPLPGIRNKRVVLSAVLSAVSPYFRLGMKFGDAREPILSAGSVQTFGHNILFHLGQNSSQGPLFVTCYQSGMRLGPNVPLPDLNVAASLNIAFEISSSGQVRVLIDRTVVVERFFVVDEMPRFVLMGWGDEHQFRCNLENVQMSIFH